MRLYWTLRHGVSQRDFARVRDVFASVEAARVRAASYYRAARLVRAFHPSRLAAQNGALGTQQWPIYVCGAKRCRYRSQR